MTIDTVYYTSADAGAPTLNNVAGSLNAVLYACLVTGFNVQTVTSMSVAAGVATLTLAGHGFTANQVIEIAGATPAGLNGRKVPLTIASGTLTFDATGITAGAATGTITVKRPGLGWTRPANTGNVAIYARSDAATTGQVLRLDDSGSGVAGATLARATMLETWTDVNTFTGQAPSAALLSGGQYWSKGANSATAKLWILVGDGLYFHLFTDNSNYPFTSYGGLYPHAFGDPISYRAGDAYGTLIAGDGTSGFDTASGLYNAQPAGYSPSLTGRTMLARLSTQVGLAVATNAVAAGAVGRFGSSGPLYPSRVDNGVIFSSPVWFSEFDSSFSHSIRGEIPGVMLPMQFGLAVRHGEVLSGVTGAPGKVLIVGLGSTSTPSPGAVGISLANWR